MFGKGYKKLNLAVKKPEKNEKFRVSRRFCKSRFTKERRK
jgi:hypothetical protein